MDLKSFIRGFGVGVLFTAMVLGISCMVRTSDSAVVRRAKKLGMEYGGGDEKLFQTADTASQGAVGTDGRDSKDGQDAAEATKSPKKKATPKPTKKKVSEPSQDDDVSAIEKEIDKLEKQAERKSRQITVGVGDWSSDVSRRLEAMDIISDADDFDRYLDKHGYGTKIKAGTYTIPPGASYKEIAKIITNQ